MARKIEVQIVGDADSFHRALSKAQGATSKFSSVLGTGLKVAAVGAGAAVVGLGAALKVGIDEFNDSQRVAAQTGAVLKSTGHAANVTAKHVDSLATSLSGMSGVDDELIGASENVLLTFRNIQNQAGKNNDIFDQATKATLDLSVAMGEDLHSASLQVGKALNDPVKGLTALKRVGVQFTDSQTTLIKKLVDTGKTAQAQKIILGELNKEFGGSAKAAGDTLPGQLNILKETFRETAGEIVKTFVPIIVNVAKVVLPLVAGALKLVARGITRLANFFSGVANDVQKKGNVIHGVFQRLSGFFTGTVVPIIHQLRDAFEKSMQNIRKVVEANGPALKRIFDRIGKAMSAIAQVAVPLLKTALVRSLPKAIDVSIKALDKISFSIETVVNWCITLIGTLDTLKHKFDFLGSLNNSLLGDLGIDIHKGLLTQGSNKAAPLQANLYLDSKLVYSAMVNQNKISKRQTGRSLLA